MPEEQTQHKAFDLLIEELYQYLFKARAPQLDCSK
jgi:hypothetical protein